MPFQTELEYDTLIKDELWQLSAPLVYEFIQRDYEGEYLKQHRIIVPAGYVTDFLSLPLLGRIIYNKEGAGKWSSVPHDYGFTHLHEVYTRKQVDKIFLKALREDPEEPTRMTRCVFYNAVRLFGEPMWRKRIEKRQMLLRSLGIECLPNGQPCVANL